MKLSLFTFLALTSLSYAETTFTPEQPIYANETSVWAEGADLDNDGDLDLIYLSSTGLNLRENLDGAGTLGPPQILTNTYPKATVGDFDNDGDQDIATFDSSSVGWYRNSGNFGNFGPRINSDNFFQIDRVYKPRDLDGDGDLDLIFNSGQYILFQLNTDGAGTFADTEAVTITGTYSNFQITDIDGNGSADLVASNSQGTPFGDDDTVVIFPGLDTSTLSFGIPYTVATGYGLLALGKIDSDNDNDIVLLNYTNSALQWISNNGNGTFSSPANIATDIYPQQIEIANGHIVIRQSFEEPALWVANTNGSGTFAAPVEIVTPSEDYYHVAVADFDNDTRTDVVALEATLSAIYFQKTANTFTAGSPFSSALMDISGLDVTDINSDGIPDILLGTEDGKILNTQLNTNGTFAGLSVLTTDQGEISKLYTAELDGQNGLDFITIDINGDNVGWSQRAANGTFGPALIVDDFGYSPNSAAFADLDNNGSIDIAVSYGGDNSCGWLSRNAGTNTYTFHTLNGTINGANGVAIGDIDGDNDPDIVSGSYQTGQIFKFTNNGSGNFSAATSIGTAPIGTRQVELADIDGDGDLDVLARETAGPTSSITLLKNNGTGTFPDITSAVDQSAGMESFALGDLDSDGDLDIVSANFNTSTVSWHENDGTGVFTSRTLTRDAASNCYDIALGDLDNDGDLDIISSSRFFRYVGWYENEFVPLPPNDDPITVWAWGKGVREPEVLDLLSDGDHDGATLLEEFAYNLDSTVNDSSRLTSPGSTGLPDMERKPVFAVDTYEGRLPRRRDAASIGLTYIAETSTDLQTWTEAPLSIWYNIDADYEFAFFHHPVTPLTAARYFMRVRLEYSPIP